MVCIADTTSTIEAVALTQKINPILAILDHKLEGEIMGLQAAPMIKTFAPKFRIILFTALELSYEASKKPAIDLYLEKHNLRKLLSVNQQLMGLEPLVYSSC